MSYKPAIVVAAYNREIPLKRILKSISVSVYPDTNINLVISIDKSNNEEVVRVANEFLWEWGEKTVLEHSINLGLRAHILKCGDLTEKFDSIILLEDDLYVSPYFYLYAKKALNFYGQETRVAGISLYSHRYNETAFMRFTPVKDEHDTYFMQVPSSWGQAWTKEQWRGFREWYEEHHTIKITSKDVVPPNVVLWPETSWKKYYFKYVIEKNKYFVYPYRALSTNCADVGTNHSDNRTCLQEPLEHNDIDYSLPAFFNSKIIYDSHCELSEGSFKHLCGELEKYDLEVDLYGCKELEKVKKKFIITSKKFTKNSVKSFGRDFKPHEMNIVYSNEGNYFHLVKTEDAISEPFKMIDSIRNSYYYDIPERFLIKVPENPAEKAKLLSSYQDFNSLKALSSYKFLKFVFRIEENLKSFFSLNKNEK